MSEDGIHWHKPRDDLVITANKFDSLDVVFGSEHDGGYLCCLRESAGFFALEIQHPDGTPVKGVTFDESVQAMGDELEGIAGWEQATDLSSLSG